MQQWMKRYNEATPQTKFFVWNAVIYSLAILITTIYCYGRLDFVRSYPSPSTIKAESQKTP